MEEQRALTIAIPHWLNEKCKTCLESLDREPHFALAFEGEVICFFHASCLSSPAGLRELLDIISRR